MIKAPWAGTASRLAIAVVWHGVLLTEVIYASSSHTLQGHRARVEALSRPLLENRASDMPKRREAGPDDL